MGNSVRETLAAYGLNLDAPWSLGSEAFEQICAIIRQNHYSAMVEFGSGSSTVGWALVCRDLSVTSFEHEQPFFEQSSGLVEKFNLSERVQVLHVPLQRCWINGRPFVSYRRTRIDPPVDVVIIDGPPHVTRRGREACLYFVYDALRVGGAVILDDYQRHDEVQIVRNWQSVYPHSFRQETLAAGQGVAVLYKVRHERRSVHYDVLRDACRVQYQQLAFGVKARLAGLRRG